MSTHLSSSQQALLAEIGIDIWVSRLAADTPQSEIADSSEGVDPVPTQDARPHGQSKMPGPVDAAVADTFVELNKEILTCTRCVLHESRTQAVCGMGNLQADVLVIGEAPGVDEDHQGEPFVGRAGQLLNEMLRAAGLERDAVFITNMLKCQPPQNRDPNADEVEQCMPFLQRQIDLVKPRVILVAGHIAAQNLLGVDMPIGRLRGQLHSYGAQDLPLIVTYHPAYLLRSPAQKAESWADLLLTMDTLAAVDA
jgi:uracil-DNA glycosylase family 4